MSESTIAVIVLSILGFAATIVINSVMATWKIAGMRGDYVKAIEESERRQATLVETQRLEIGETFLSIRRQVETNERGATDKLTELAFFLRDNYVRRDTFMAMMDRIEKNITLQSERLEARIVSIDLLLRPVKTEHTK